MPASSRRPNAEYLTITAVILSLLGAASLLSRIVITPSAAEVQTDAVRALSYHLVISALAAAMTLGVFGVINLVLSFVAWFQIMFLPEHVVDSTPRIVIQARVVLILSVAIFIAVISALMCLYLVT